MTAWVKQSTAITVKLGPFVDDTDGKTAETALTISQADVRLSKNGGDIAQKNDATAATHDELGYYDVSLNATDTNTLGRLLVAVSESGALPVWADFMVVPANVWDSLFGADKLQVHVDEMTAGIITATVIATDAIDADAIAAGAIDSGAFAAGAINAAAIAADAITAAKIADAAIDAATFATGAITAAAIAADAITDAKVAADVTIASVTGAVGSVTGSVGSVTGAVGSVTGNVGGNVAGSVASVTAGVTLAANAVSAAALAADAVTEIQSGLSTLDAAGVRTAIGLATANLDTQLADLPTNAELATSQAASDDATLAAIAALNNLSAAQVNAEVDTALSDVGLTTTITGRIDATISTRASQASLDAVDDFLDTEIASILEDTNELQTDLVNGGRLDLLIDAIKAKTDNLPAAPAATGDIPTAASIADTVWEEAIADHSGTAGSTAAALGAAGAAGDPWITELPGAYAVDSAGWLVGNHLDIHVSTRASQTSVDDLPTNAELATALDTSDDATLAAIAALNNLSAAQVNAEVDTALADVGLTTTVTGRIDTTISSRLATAGYTAAPTVSEILAGVIEGSITLRGALRLAIAVLAGKTTGGGSATVTFRDVADGKARVTATLDNNGNRTAIIRDITD